MASRISDLIVRRGEVEGQRHLNRGNAWSHVALGLSQILPGMRQRRQEDEDRAAVSRVRDAQLRTEGLQQQNAQGQIDARANATMDEQATRDLALTTQRVNAWLGDVAAAGNDLEAAKAAYAAGRQQLVAAGRLTPADAPDVFPGMSWVKSRLTMLLPATERFKQLFPEPEEPEPFTLGPGQQRFDANGQPIASVPERPPAPATPAGFTLSPGQQRFGPDGRPIASMPERPQADGRGPVNGAVDPSTRALAEMTARSGQLPEGTPTFRGDVMRGVAGDPALLGQYEQARMKPVRAQAQTMLSALDDLITTDGELTPGARALFGEFTPVWSRGAGVKSGTVSANASLRQVIGQQVVDLIREMKSQSQTGATGFGQLNLAELDIILSAATRLTQRLPESEARQELATLREKFSKIMQPGAAELSVGGAGMVTVQTPAGPMVFPNQQAADAFKARAGL